jgi:2-haloacid dehalogenase
MRYDIILFDADGTLMDFRRSEAEAIRQVMTWHGIEPTEENIRTYSEGNHRLWKMLEVGQIEKDVLVYRRFELLFEALGMTGDAKKMSSDYIDALSNKGYLLDGAEELCRSLLGKVKMYIVTNGVEKTQRGRYAICGIDDCFEEIFISGAIGAEKPSPVFFEYVAEHIDGFEKSRAIIVGDSLTSDIKGGINFGIDTCWYNPTGEKAPDGMDITYIATDFDDVKRIIMGEDIQ